MAPQGRRAAMRRGCSAASADGSGREPKGRISLLGQLRHPEVAPREAKHDSSFRTTVGWPLVSIEA